MKIGCIGLLMEGSGVVCATHPAPSWGQAPALHFSLPAGNEPQLEEVSWPAIFVPMHQVSNDGAWGFRDEGLRASSLGPNLCRLTIPSLTPSLDTHRLAQKGHTLSTTTRSVTSAGLNTTSITSRRRPTVPPCRTHSQLGHRSTACITCLSATPRLRANHLERFLRGCLGPFGSGLLGLSQVGGFGPGRSFRVSSRSTSNCSTRYSQPGIFICLLPNDIH